MSGAPSAAPARPQGGPRVLTTAASAPGSPRARSRSDGRKPPSQGGRAQSSSLDGGPTGQRQGWWVRAARAVDAFSGSCPRGRSPPPAILTCCVRALQRSRTPAPPRNSVLPPAPCPPRSPLSGTWPRHSPGLRDLGGRGARDPVALPAGSKRASWSGDRSPKGASTPLKGPGAGRPPHAPGPHLPDPSGLLVRQAGACAGFCSRLWAPAPTSLRQGATGK